MNEREYIDHVAISFMAAVVGREALRDPKELAIAAYAMAEHMSAMRNRRINESLENWHMRAPTSIRE